MLQLVHFGYSTKQIILACVQQKFLHNFSYITRSLFLDFWFKNTPSCPFVNPCNYIDNLSSAWVKAVQYTQGHRYSEKWLLTCWIQTSHVFFYLKQSALLPNLVNVSGFHGAHFPLFLGRGWDSLCKSQGECNRLPALPGCFQSLDPLTVTTGGSENSPLAQEGGKIFLTESNFEK